MRTFLCGAALSALLATPLAAAQAPNVMTNSKDATATATGGQRVLYVCDQTRATRRAFAREYGRTEFVRADEAVGARGAWSAPKCISRSEANRLRERLASR